MAARQVLEVLRQPAAAAEPAERALHDPALGQYLEAVGRVRALDDLERNAGLGADIGRRGGALVAAVGDCRGDRGMKVARHLQERADGIAVLDIGGGDEETDQQAERIDRRVPLLSLDFLARVIASRINVGPPFSALLTLWLSTIASVGDASFSASSRHFVCSA